MQRPFESYRIPRHLTKRAADDESEKGHAVPDFELLIEGVSLDDLVKKLGGGQGIRQIMANELVLVKNTSVPPLPLWKMIKLGADELKSGQDLIARIKQVGCDMSPEAKKFLQMESFMRKMYSHKVDLELVLASHEDLGLKHRARFGDVLRRVEDRGLALCPPETGPQLRWQYFDQKKDRLVIAMRPLNDGQGRPVTFMLTAANKVLPWLTVENNYENVSWEDCLWVCARHTLART